MPKLVMIVDVPDAQPTHEDPHEAAADILYHYEAHRETNQDDREVRFVQASWQEPIEDLLRFFEATDGQMLEPADLAGGETDQPEFTKVWPVDYDDDDAREWGE